MDVDIALNPVCSKCDRHAVAFNEKHLPLCGRHAMIFLTAPRMIARDQELQKELQEELDREHEQTSEPSVESVADEATQSTGGDDKGDDVLAAILERLTAIEKALGLPTQPPVHPGGPTTSGTSDAPLPLGNVDRRRSDQGRRTTDMRSGPTVVESAHELSRPWTSGGAR